MKNLIEAMRTLKEDKNSSYVIKNKSNTKQFEIKENDISNWSGGHSNT